MRHYIQVLGAVGTFKAYCAALHSSNVQWHQGKGGLYNDIYLIKVTVKDVLAMKTIKVTDVHIEIILFQVGGGHPQPTELIGQRCITEYLLCAGTIQRRRAHGR